MQVIRTMFVILAACIAMAISQPAKAFYVGVDYPWVGYGWGFGSSYSASTAATNLTAIAKTYHCNYVRIWVCEGLDGLTVSSGKCTGFSSTNLANIKNFVAEAHSLGIQCDVVFINYLDIQNTPALINNSTNRTALVNNGFIPLVKALNGYGCWFDLINEGNLATNDVTWVQLRAFGQLAVSTSKADGYTPWITMSDQNGSDYTSYFSSTVGGNGFSYYEFHAYNNTGYLSGVSSSTVGGAPIILSEYGPASAWNDNSASTNSTCIDDFIYNAKNAGYIGASAWCYVPDGSNWQLNANSAIWTIEYYGNYYCD